jgi:hypothetical protein
VTLLHSSRASARRSDRAVAPVVGKALEAGLVVLFVVLVTTALSTAVVPGYERVAGQRVADRTLAGAAERVQQAVPPATRHAAARSRVDLPRTIAGQGYRVRTDGRALVLDHPDDALAARSRLALPTHVVRVEGSWSSRQPSVVSVDRDAGGFVVRLVRGDAS